MELIDGKGSANQARAEDGSVDDNELPHGRVVVGEHLELSVKVEVQVDESSESSGRVTRRHRLEAVVDLLLVARADAAVEHDLAVAVGNVARGTHVLWDHRLAHGEEVRAETSDEPFDEDLEDGRGDEGVQETDGCIVHVPEAADADLADEEDGDGDQGCHEGGSINGNDLVAQWVCELGVDNLAIREDDCLKSAKVHRS